MRIFVTSLLILILFSISLGSIRSNGASSSDFAVANSTINSAFNAIQNAEQNGGNVTTLIVKLDISLNLVQKAQSENSTNPTQATMDLQNATQIANQVLGKAPAIARQGSSAKQTMVDESIGSAVTILILAGLVYVYGARIYHLTWFYLYRNHSVRSPEESLG
jgi:predicted PurR-regulated permease PerM